MRHQYRTQISVTVLVGFAELAHLGWEHFNGGVVSHHLLNRADMPAISNAWGLLLLPLLSWVLSGLAYRQAGATSQLRFSALGLPLRVLAGLGLSLLLGILLSTAFTLGQEAAAGFLFLGMFVLALIFRVYRPQCLLGFVLGMTFTFGAVLPTLIGAVIATVSAIAHLGIRPQLIRAWHWSRLQRAART